MKFNGLIPEIVVSNIVSNNIRGGFCEKESFFSIALSIILEGRAEGQKSAQTIRLSTFFILFSCLYIFHHDFFLINIEFAIKIKVEFFI